ncbi:MAG TPA: glycine cleavage system protein T, partial [Thermomicrobiales bacterium]|nr:glycine cleavage system protein T [Thermomicrobiales bacterium]
MTDETLKRSPLYDKHVALGAKIIPFAGYEMPVQYAGIIAEHNAVRNEAGLFDLSHMGQVDVRGPEALEFLQAITPNDVAELAPGQAHYSMLPTPEGGLIDDILIYRNPGADGYMVVINAANHARDVAWMLKQREVLGF